MTKLILGTPINSPKKERALRPESAGSQQLIKDINRMALVRHLCANPGLSRADLAPAVELTKSTISLLVRELIAEGWLIERELITTGDLGRRPTPLFIDPSRLLMLGVEIGIGSVRIVATTLTGEVLTRTQGSFGVELSVKDCITSLAAGLQRVRKQLQSTQKIIGIGVGLPGGVDEASGTLQLAPNLGWRDVPFGALLRDKLKNSALADVPLFVQNEADVAAVGEHEFNPGAVANPLLYVSINQGVGAGVIVNDRLLTGHRGFAGEVGHMVLQVNGPLCTCGRRGCAEALIGLRALQQIPLHHDQGTLTDPLAEVQHRLGEQQNDTLRAVSIAGGYLGVLLQNLVSAFDPGCIVLGGTVVSLGDAYLQPALQTMADYAAAANLTLPSVRVSQFGNDAVAIGAAAMVRYRLTRPTIRASGSGIGVVTQQESH
jgi:predicted NBD/HSP70 family sugar kinase